MQDNYFVQFKIKGINPSQEQKKGTKNNIEL